MTVDPTAPREAKCAVKTTLRRWVWRLGLAECPHVGCRLDYCEVVDA